MSSSADMQRVLLEYMGAETVAARALFMDGLLEQAAFHVMRAWHALACLQAQERGESSPSLSEYKVDPAATPIASRVKKAGPTWSESMEATRQLAASMDLDDGGVEQLVSAAAPTTKERRLRRKQLELQIRLVEETQHKLYMKARFARLQSRFSRKAVLGVLGGVAMLAVGAVIVYTLNRGSGEAGDGDQSGGGQGGGDHQDAPPPAPPPLKGPALISTSLDKLNKAIPNGADWRRKGNVIFFKKLRVTIGKVVHFSKVDISLDNNDNYALLFMKEGQETGSTPVGLVKENGMQSRKVETHADAVKSGYDTIMVTAVEGDDAYSVGHILLSD